MENMSRRRSVAFIAVANVTNTIQLKNASPPVADGAGYVYTNRQSINQDP